MPAQSEIEQERRRHRRALIRAYHPDTGADTAEFVRLLHYLDEERPPTNSWPEVRFVRQRPWWHRAAATRFRRTSQRPKRVV